MNNVYVYNYNFSDKEVTILQLEKGSNHIIS